MSKINKTKFVGTTAISIATGKFGVTKIPTTPEGRVVRLVVFQASGTAVAFTVDMVENLDGMTLGDNTGSLPADIALYRVMPQQSVTSGSTLYIYDIDEGHHYINDEGNPTIRVRNLYLVISPTGAAGTTTWDACVVTESFYAS